MIVKSPSVAGARLTVMDKLPADALIGARVTEPLATLTVSEPDSLNVVLPPPNVTPKSVSVTDGLISVRIELRLIEPVSSTVTLSK